MAPSDHNSPERDAFDALPSGTPPPGLDTRISALARDAVTPRRSRRLTQFAGSLATLALAAFLVRPLWHAAPDTVPTSTPGSAEVSAPVASQISAAAEADELVLEEAVIFDRARREFRLLKEQHPDFTLPEGVPAATRALLGLPNQE